MNIEYFRQYFEKKSQKNGFKYKIGEPASDILISESERRLNVEFPHQVKLFYMCCDGITVETPALEILPLEKLIKDDSELIHFSTFDGKHKLCFETTNLNEADQWSIINCVSEYEVTLTMSSFWSNKIWAWIDKNRTIWKEENRC